MTGPHDGLTHVVPDAAAGQRLVDHARERLAVVAVREVGELIRRGGLLQDDEVVPIASPLSPGDVLRVTVPAWHDLVARDRVVPVSDRPLRLHHRDDDLVVVEKVAGLHVHPMGRHREDTVLGAVLALAGAGQDRPWAAWRPHPVHRLDRPVSGLLAFACDRAGRDVLQRQLERHAVDRTYRALVHGHPDRDAGTIDLPLGRHPDDPTTRGAVSVAEGGQEAVTHWRVLARRDDGTSELELRLETGRTHQVRAHLGAIGHPILDDRRYGATSGAPVGQGRVTGLPTIALHASALALDHPRTGERLHWTSPPPWEAAAG